MVRPSSCYCHAACSAVLLATLGATPELRAQAEEDYSTEDEGSVADGFQLFDRVALGAQWFWAKDKIMPGLEFSIGYDLVQVDFEASFLGLTERSAEIDGSFLGNQLGFFLMLTPLRERYYDVSAGLGGDFYLLWGIQSEVTEAALAPRLQLRAWPLQSLGVTLNARVYLVSSDGLELGTERDRSDGLPLLVSTGLTYRFQ